MVKYLYCDKCGGYYVLNPGESPQDFSDKCECGGHLILGEMAEKTEEEKLKELADKQVASERNREFVSFSIGFYTAVVIGIIIGSCSIFLIPTSSSFSPIIFSLFAFGGSGFITSLIIKKDAKIPSTIIPKKIDNNPQFKRAYAGMIASMTLGGLIELTQGVISAGHVDVSTITFLIDIILGIAFFMILGLILGFIGGFIGVFIRDILSKVKSSYFPSEKPSEENDTNSHDIIVNSPIQESSTNSKDIKTPKTIFRKKFSSLQKLLIVFAVIFILLLGYASLNGFFEPKSHYNSKGVSFDYPSKYVVDTSIYPDFKDTSDLEFLSSIVTVALDNKDDLGFVVYKLNPSKGKDAMITFVSSMATSDNGIIVSQNNVKVDNTDGHEVVSSDYGNKQVPTTKFVYFTKNNVDYLIIFYSNNLEKMQSDINIIINSFHVTY